MMENEAMAEYVSNENFDEYAKRMDGRFDHVIQRVDDRFHSLEKNVDAGFVHVGQRFDSLEKRMDESRARMDQFHGDMRQMNNWLMRLFMLVSFSFIGVIALILLRDLIFK